MGSPRIAEVDFTELSNRSLIEIIEDPANPGRTRLAVYHKNSVRYASRIVAKDRILVPFSRDQQDLRHVRLAQGAEPYGSLSDLEREIARLIYECVDIPPKWRELMMAFAICTWLPEKMLVAPYLAFVGPPSSGKTTAMRVLNQLCYRALLTADISSSAFYDISNRIRPTILLDETLTAGRPRELIHLLKVSSTPDSVSLRKDTARLAYGPKVFSWLQLPDDPALNSRCVIIPTYRSSRTDLQSPSDAAILEQANKIRMHLLWFRFEEYKKLSAPKIPADVRLVARPLDLYRALALPFEQDQKMCEFLAYLMVEQSSFETRILSPEQASALRVLYHMIHKSPYLPCFRMRDLAAAVNSDLAGCGESARLNERKLGSVLTALSFTNRLRTNTGYLLQLDRSDRVRIHTSTREYDIEGIHTSQLENCEICEQTNRTTTSVPAEFQVAQKWRAQRQERERSERGERPTRTARSRIPRSR